MNIESDRPKIIFRHTKEDKVFYSIGLSKKDIDGNYINGAISCRFPKGVDIPDRTKIMVRNGWLDFYVKDKITYPYLFISQYEIVNEKQQEEKEVPQNIQTDYDDSGIQLEDNDLPF